MIIDGDSSSWHFPPPEARASDTEESSGGSDAHTEGDSIVQFREGNIIHAGDTSFNGFYPFIDIGKGGTVRDASAAAEGIMALADNATKNIPDHGPLTEKEQDRAHRGTSANAQERLGAIKTVVKSANKAAPEKPLADPEAQ